MPTAPSFLLRGERLPLFLLALVFLAGLFLRIGVVAESAVLEPVRGDARSYFFYAVNLTEEGVYSRSMPAFFGGKGIKPDAAAQPGFPLFVTALLDDSWRSGNASGVYGSIIPVIDAQALLSSLAIVAVFFIGRMLAGAWVGLSAAALTAISPHLVNINIYLLTEPLFIVVFWLALALLAHAAVRPDARGLLVLGGLALGLATLVRPTVQYLPLVLAGLAVAAAPRNWQRSALLLGGFLLPMLAWAARNFVALGAVGSASGMVATIQVGSYPGFMYNGDPASLGMPYRFDPVLRDYSSLSTTLAVMKERFIAAPGEHLYWYLIGKPLALFNWDTIPIGSGTASHLLVAGDIYQYPTPITPYAGQPAFIATYLASKVLYLPLLILALAGAVLAWIPALAPLWGRGLPVMRLLGITLAYVIGIHMVGSPFPRYAVPFLPTVYLLALATLAGLLRHFRSRRAGVIEPQGAVL